MRSSPRPLTRTTRTRPARRASSTGFSPKINMDDPTDGGRSLRRVSAGAEVPAPDRRDAGTRAPTAPQGQAGPAVPASSSSVTRSQSTRIQGRRKRGGALATACDRDHAGRCRQLGARLDRRHQRDPVPVPPARPSGPGESGGTAPCPFVRSAAARAPRPRGTVRGCCSVARLASSSASVTITSACAADFEFRADFWTRERGRRIEGEDAPAPAREPAGGGRPTWQTAAPATPRTRRLRSSSTWTYPAADRYGTARRAISAGAAAFRY